MPFWNHNGIILPIGGFQPENACMSFGLQKGSKLKSELGNEKYGPWAFQNRSRNIAAISRTIFRSLWKNFQIAKFAKIMILMKNYQTLKMYKNWLRGHSEIPGTVLESWRSILLRNQHCINRIWCFCVFLEPERYIRFPPKENLIYHSGSKKTQKH